MHARHTAPAEGSDSATVWIKDLESSRPPTSPLRRRWSVVPFFRFLSEMTRRLWQNGYRDVVRRHTRPLIAFLSLFNLLLATLVVVVFLSWGSLPSHRPTQPKPFLLKRISIGILLLACQWFPFLQGWLEGTDEEQPFGTSWYSIFQHRSETIQTPFYLVQRAQRMAKEDKERLFYFAADIKDLRIQKRQLLSSYLDDFVAFDQDEEQSSYVRFDRIIPSKEEALYYLELLESIEAILTRIQNHPHHNSKDLFDYVLRYIKSEQHGEVHHINYSYSGRDGFLKEEYYDTMTEKSKLFLFSENKYRTPAVLAPASEERVLESIFQNNNNINEEGNPSEYFPHEAFQLLTVRHTHLMNDKHNNNISWLDDLYSIYNYKPYFLLQRLEANRALFRLQLYNQNHHSMRYDYNRYWQAVSAVLQTAFPSSADPITVPPQAKIPLQYYTTQVRPYLSTIERILEVKEGSLAANDNIKEQYKTLFISIASFRDDECRHTLRDIILKSKRRERVFVGIAEQHYYSEDYHRNREYRYRNEKDNTYKRESLDPSCVSGLARLPMPCQHHHKNESEVCFFQSNIRRRRVHPSQSRGPTYGRYLSIVLLYQGEDYLMKIDSHTRFIPFFDAAVILLFSKYGTENRKTILSHYPLQYEPEKDNHNTNHHHNSFYQFHKTAYLCQAVYIKRYGYPRFSGVILNLSEDNHMNEEDFSFNLKYSDAFAPLTTFDLNQNDNERLFRNKKKYLPQPFVAGGFLFGHAPTILSQVPPDPFLTYIFDGEEIMFAARLFTHRFNLFSPPMSIVYHYYVRKEAKHVYAERTRPPQPNHPVPLEVLPYALQHYSRKRIQYVLHTRPILSESEQLELENKQLQRWQERVALLNQNPNAKRYYQLIHHKENNTIEIKNSSLQIGEVADRSTSVFYEKEVWAPSLLHPRRVMDVDRVNSILHQYSENRTNKESVWIPYTDFNHHNQTELPYLISALLDADRYGLGKSRSLAHYYRYAQLYYDVNHNHNDSHPPAMIGGGFCGWWDSGNVLKRLKKE